MSRSGAIASVDRGALGDTLIGRGTVIDNLVQIAHNVRIGRHCVLAAQVGIAGSAEIGDNVMIGGQVAIVDHVKIGANARIAGKSGIMRDVPEEKRGAAFRRADPAMAPADRCLLVSSGQSRTARPERCDLYAIAQPVSGSTPGRVEAARL